MVPNIVIAAVGLVFLTLFLIEKTRKYSVKATLLKATTSILFIALGVVSSYLKPEGGLFSALAILGLAFGMLGDVWLDFKYVFKNEDKIFTYAGFVSFAIGHIFYITGMFLRFWQEGASVLYIILPFVAGALLALIFVGFLIENAWISHCFNGEALEVKIRKHESNHTHLFILPILYGLCCCEFIYSPRI